MKRHTSERETLTHSSKQAAGAARLRRVVTGAARCQRRTHSAAAAAHVSHTHTHIRVTTRIPLEAVDGPVQLRRISQRPRSAVVVAHQHPRVRREACRATTDDTGFIRRHIDEGTGWHRVGGVGTD
jgi:hypothetical protein